jgi:hypothetical protein
VESPRNLAAVCDLDLDLSALALEAAEALEALEGVGSGGEDGGCAGGPVGLKLGLEGLGDRVRVASFGRARSGGGGGRL